MKLTTEYIHIANPYAEISKVISTNASDTWFIVQENSESRSCKSKFARIPVLPYTLDSSDAACLITAGFQLALQFTSPNSQEVYLVVGTPVNFNDDNKIQFWLGIAIKERR